MTSLFSFLLHQRNTDSPAKTPPHLRDWFGQTLQSIVKIYKKPHSSSDNYHTMPYYFKNPLDLICNRRPARPRRESVASEHRRIQARIPKTKVNIAPSECSRSGSVASYASTMIPMPATPSTPTTPFSLLEFSDSPFEQAFSAESSRNIVDEPTSPSPAPSAYTQPAAIAFSRRIAEEAIAAALEKRILSRCILGYREHWTHVNDIQVKLISLYPDLASIYTPTRLEATTLDWEFAFATRTWNLVLLVPTAETSFLAFPGPSKKSRKSFRSSFSTRFAPYRKSKLSKDVSSNLFPDSSLGLSVPTTDKFPTRCTLPASTPYAANAAQLKTVPIVDDSDWEEVCQQPPSPSPTTTCLERKRKQQQDVGQAQREAIYFRRAAEIVEEDRAAGLGKFAPRPPPPPSALVSISEHDIVARPSHSIDNTGFRRRLTNASASTITLATISESSSESQALEFEMDVEDMEIDLDSDDGATPRASTVLPLTPAGEARLRGITAQLADAVSTFQTPDPKSKVQYQMAEQLQLQLASSQCESTSSTSQGGRSKKRNKSESESESKSGSKEGLEEGAENVVGRPAKRERRGSCAREMLSVDTGPVFDMYTFRAVGGVNVESMVM